MIDPAYGWLAVAATFVLAGLVKGVIGLGLPTVAMALLATIMTPAEAAAMLIVPSAVTNVWQFLSGRSPVPLVRRLGTMLIGICLGTALGAGILVAASGNVTATALGAALVVYAALGLADLRLAVPRAWEPVLSPLVGGATGAVAAATGVFVVPAAPYLQSLGLERDDLVQALGLSFTVSTVALGVMLFGDGAFDAGRASASAAALAPALIGMTLGARLRSRIAPHVFRPLFFTALLALGVHLAV